MSRLPRPVSISLKILLSTGMIAYLVWQINIGQTIKLIGSANGLYLLAALAIFLVDDRRHGVALAASPRCKGDR